MSRQHYEPGWTDTHPQTLRPLDVGICHVCGAELIDDDEESWPYCPRGHE